MIHSHLHKISDFNTHRKIYLFYLIRIAAASALLALSSQVSFTLPFTLVPFTLQTEALLFIALFGGSKIAVGAVSAYFAQGLIGLPVFAGGVSGIWAFLSPSGGYLLGFLPAAFIMGACADRGWTKNIFLTAAAVFLGKITIFSCGLMGLSLFIPANQLLAAGLYPFMTDSFLQIIGAALTAPVLARR